MAHGQVLIAGQAPPMYNYACSQIATQMKEFREARPLCETWPAQHEIDTSTLDHKLSASASTRSCLTMTPAAIFESGGTSIHTR